MRLRYTAAAMKLPARLSNQHSLRRWVAACAIGLACAVVGMVLWAPFAVLGAVRTLDFVFYDSLYRLRTRPAGGHLGSRPAGRVALAAEELGAVGELSEFGGGEGGGVRPDLRHAQRV